MDLMIDLETLDTKPGGIILSIGTVVFDPDTGVSPGKGMFYERLSQDSQLPLHMTASADTVEWWSKQSAEAQAILTDDQQSTALTIYEALAKLDNFIYNARNALPDDSGGEFGAVWAQGQGFDFGILGEAYRRARGIEGEMPWPFWSHRDTRTAYGEHGFDTSTVERTGVHHNALADCVHQIKCLLAARRQTRLASKHFNGLTPAELERLAMLSEEAGEVVQIVGKIIRHGYESHHPDDPETTNRSLLEAELADVNASQLRMEVGGDVFTKGIDIEKVMGRKDRFTHHQGD